MIKEAQQLCALGITEESLATYWQIAPNTLRRWKHKIPDFCLAIEKGKLDANIAISTALFNNARKGNLSAQIFWLTNRMSQVWSDKRALVNNFNINRNENNVGSGDFKGNDAAARDQLKQWLNENYL